MTRGAALATALILAASAPVALPAQADTTAADTTTQADSALAPDTTAAWLPVAPPILPPGPLPLGRRLVFPADSLVFSNIRTLADLLVHVPGVYVARGGFYGQGEYALFGGRAAAGVEVFWDGVPLRPLGRDSVFLDLGRIPLAPIERVEVIRHPAALEVHLVTRRHASTEAETSVGIVTGRANIARYVGTFARRWRSGLGLSLLVDWNDHDGFSGSSTAFGNTDVWVKAGWIPSDLFGVEYQVVSASWKRNGEAGRVDAWKQRRRDAVLRAFAAERGDGLGWRAELAWARTTVDQDTAAAEAQLSQGSATASYRWPAAHVALTARAATRPPWPFELLGSAAWAPVSLVTLSADAGRVHYPSHGTGEYGRAAAGVLLPFGLSARGEVAWRRGLGAPALTDDTLVTTTDVTAAVRWDHRLATIELGGGRRDPFAPVGRPAALATVSGLAATPATDFVSVHASLRPTVWLAVSGWFVHPSTGAADFAPPHHARLAATFHSKFWRTFRSGIFTLRGELAMESWSRGFGGLDTTAAATPLPLLGATFVETDVQLQIGDVTISWAMRNQNAMRGRYVTGLDYPKAVQYYGVTWRFRN